MSFRVQRLDVRHNEALLALAAQTDTGSSAFRIDRSPDFFALGRLLGDAEFWGAFDGPTLVGCLGITRQRRTLRGEAADTRYIHDVRTDPDRPRPGLLRRLFEEALNAHRGDSDWAFSVVLDSNLHRRGLMGGRLFPPGRAIGTTVHLGLPLMATAAEDSVREVSVDEAWRMFRDLAGAIDFAPADHAQFASMTGPCVALHASDEVVAVARLVDQSAARRILVGDGESKVEFPHLYLAYYAAREGYNARRAFTGYAAARFGERYGYLFVGVPPEELHHYEGPGMLTLTSTTIAYGNVPERVAFDYRELTLI